MTRRGLILLLLLGLLWGLPYLLIRVAVGQFSPAQIVFVRAAVGACVLLPFCLRRRFVLSGRLLGWIAAFAAADIAAPYLLISTAEQTQTSSTTVLIIASTPALTVLLDRKRSLSLIQGAGLAVGAVGVAAVVRTGLAHITVWSVLESGLAALGYAAGAQIVGRQLAGLPGVSVAALALGMTAVGFAPAAAGCASCLVLGRAWLALLVLAVACTGVALATVFSLIKEVGPPRAALITYINPPVAAVLGVLVLHEAVTLGLMLGLPLILGGAVLATRQEGRPPERRAPTC